MPYSTRTALIVGLLGTAAWGCGSEETDPAPAPSGCASFDSTFEAIQKSMFERRGCTQAACHGSAASGGLDLRDGAAYASWRKPRNRQQAHARPAGRAERKLLYLKLKAATDPWQRGNREQSDAGGLPAAERGRARSGAAVDSRRCSRKGLDG